MSLENIKSNVVTVTVSGVNRILNLEQVLFATVGATTSVVYVNEGVTPASFTIEGDFRNLVAGAGGGVVMNSGPLFGAFTETSGHTPVVINFDKFNRFIDASTLTFSNYGTVAAFTFTLLESVQNVLGASGLSLQDVGIFSVNKYSGFVAPPVQSAAGHAATGGLVPDDTYYLKIVAVNTNGRTIGSNEISVTTTGGGLSTITANWAASTGASGYQVFIGTASGAESSYYVVGAVTTLLILGVPGDVSGTVPTTNTAQIPNTQEFINAKNITHQIPSGTNWATTFVDASSVLYVESIKDLTGG